MPAILPETMNGTSLKTAGEKCELRMEHSRAGKVVVYDSTQRDDSDADETSHYAIVARKYFDDKHELEKCVLRINSPFLLKIFRTAVGSYLTVPNNFESPFEIESPFSLLHHYWDEIEAFHSSVTEDVVRTHLDLLLNFMKKELGKDKSEYDDMIKGDTITYFKLWMIFRPGSLQYHSVDGQPWILRLTKTAYEETEKCGKFLEVHCTYTDFDGEIAGVAPQMIKIFQRKSFPAETMTLVTELPIFPRHFVKDQDFLEEKLAKRGSKCLGLRGMHVKKYDGLAYQLKSRPFEFYHPSMSQWPAVWIPFTETGRIVLDRKTFQEDNHADQVDITAIEPGKALDTILCPPYIFGYSLARKEWCKFFVDMIHDVEWQKDAFERLIVKDNQKKILLPLVSAHAFPTDVRDGMQQKGKGLVVLLHGSPGSGKTLTAESAAEVTEKALLSTTVGELNKGGVPFLFETALQKLLTYATIWKAVVLLDEADVFLEARSHEQADSSTRNALVAVFLRHLEYFSGIVFLTSNRVGVFDKAMISRLHLAIEYTSPESEIRRIIWNQYLSDVPSSERDLNLEKDIITLSKETLNGREIANTVNTARTIARFEKRSLHLDDLETILQVRRDFEAFAATTELISAD